MTSRFNCPTKALILMGLVLGVQSLLQTLVIYISNEPGARSFKFKKHVSHHIPSDNPVYCVQGLWIGYSQRDFQGKTIILNSQDGTEKCFLNENLPFDLRSLRFGGHQDTSKFACSFYSDIDFLGKERPFTGGAIGRLDSKSFICTSDYSWTLYEQRNFDDDGKMFCIRSNNRDNLGIQAYPNVFRHFKIPQISSVLNGCSED